MYILSRFMGLTFVCPASKTLTPSVGYIVGHGGLKIEIEILARNFCTATTRATTSNLDYFSNDMTLEAAILDCRHSNFGTTTTASIINVTTLKVVNFSTTTTLAV